MAIPTQPTTPPQRPFAALWRALADGLAYAVGLFALLVEAPAFAPWTEDPR